MTDGHPFTARARSIALLWNATQPAVREDLRKRAPSLSSQLDHVAIQVTEHPDRSIHFATAAQLMSAWTTMAYSERTTMHIQFSDLAVALDCLATAS